MDWFNRKKVAELEKKAEQLYHARRKASHWKFVAKMRENKIELLEARIAAQKFDIDRLVAEINKPLPSPSRVPLHVSEEEEDIIFARDSQLIGRAEAEDMLRELQFEYPNVFVDDGEDF